MHDSVSQPTRTSASESRSDVFIAGAGPAGLACAIAAAQEGLSVTIADGMSPPIDKACGEGLLPDTVAVLEALGISLSALPSSISSPLDGIRFIGPRRRSRGIVKTTRAEARFHRVCGIGLERTNLHQLLLDRASSLGVRICWKTVVQSVTSHASSHSIHTNRGEYTGRFLIGADGHASRIRALSGLDQGRISSRRFGLRQHFYARPWSSLVEVYWSDRGEAYVTPVGDNKVCVAFLDLHPHTSISEALTSFPELIERLASAQPADSPRGAVSLTRRLKRVTRGNVALVGDASGSVDAITGEGLSLAFSQALALAPALRRGNLASYQRSHRAIRFIPALMSGSMLLLDRFPPLRNVILSTLALHSSVFDTFLRIHIFPRTTSRNSSASKVAKVSEIAPSVLYMG